MKSLLTCWIAVLTIIGASANSDAATMSLVADGMHEPFAVAVDNAGRVIVCEANGKLSRLDAKGSPTLIAGSGEKGFSGDGGPATQAKLNFPHNFIIARNGDLLITDTLNSRVRKVDAKTGIITTIAGAGGKGFAGDGGPAEKANFAGIFSIVLNRDASQMFICDLGNRRIRAMAMKTGIVTTVAGNGQKGVPEDGSLATSSPLADPRAVCVDSKGNVYVLERGGHALRVVGNDGKIRTVAGTGKGGNSGDGGEALKAQMNGPKHLIADREDNILICDTENHVIRKYIPASGKIVRVAGTGKRGATVDRDPLKTELNRPHGVYVHTDGSIYIADSENGRVLKISK